MGTYNLILKWSDDHLNRDLWFIIWYSDHFQVEFCQVVLSAPKQLHLINVSVIPFCFTDYRCESRINRHRSTLCTIFHLRFNTSVTLYDAHRQDAFFPFSFWKEREMKDEFAFRVRINSHLLNMYVTTVHFKMILQVCSRYVQRSVVHPPSVPRLHCANGG